jgi:hypothetical protein
MNAPSPQVVTIGALESATDAMLVALSRRPDPDFEGAAEALKAREAALMLLLRTDPTTRPPDLSARLRRILERDYETADHLRVEMEALRMRLADTRQLLDAQRDAGRVRERIR